jgi:uncharacterized protein
MTVVHELAIAPVQGAERMDVLDAVRGAAVFGILLANVIALSGLGFVDPDHYHRLPLAEWHPPIWFGVLFLIEAKFYSLFSFLFGVGFAVFISRASGRRADGAKLFKRRLTGLLIIGLLHSLLLWMGDILLTYAILGFALLPFMRKDDRVILRWGFAMLLLPMALYALAVAAVALAGPASAMPAADAAAASALPSPLQNAVDGFATGSYTDVIAGNAVFTVAQVARRFILMFFPRMFGMFLLGFYVGRRRIFASLAQHRSLLVGVCTIGVLVGLPLSYAGAAMEADALGMRLPDARGLLEMTVKTFGVPLLALGYAAGLSLLFLRFAGLRRAFAAPGQMALSSYLTHSVVGVGIFYGIGLGLWGQVPLALVMAGAVGLFAIQMVVSRIWLTCAAFGPVEWLWRMFTYRRGVPLWRS